MSQTVAVHPRIRARRVSVVRDAGRRRLRRVAVLGAMVAVAIVVLALTWTPALDVDRIEVEGGRHTSTEMILDAAGIAPGDALTWFDPAGAELAIATLPWVDEATVTRHWPGTVTVEVRERVAAGVVEGADGEWLVADAEGRVLATSVQQPLDLALIEGFVASAEPGDTLDAGIFGPLAVTGALPDVLRGEVASVRTSDDDVEVLLRAGGVVFLGDAEDAADKLASAAAVLDAVPAGCVERLDVSLPTAPALVRVEGCA